MTESTESKSPMYYWRLSVFGQAPITATVEGTLISVKQLNQAFRTTISSSHKNAIESDLSELIQKQADIMHPNSSCKWRIVYDYSFGTTNPDTIEPDGKDHVFRVRVEVYYELIPKSYVVRVTGKSAAYPNTTQFMDDVKAAAVGKDTEGKCIVIRQITAL